MNLSMDDIYALVGIDREAERRAMEKKINKIYTDPKAVAHATFISERPLSKRCRQRLRGQRRLR